VYTLKGIGCETEGAKVQSGSTSIRIVDAES
jgi:hypothetical protein